MTKISTHCQICARAIRTVVGYGPLGGDAAGRTDRIAHHGFQRPHQQGWQSASCFGARWRPYEVACDALPPAIAGIEGYIARQQIALAKFILEPPAKLQYDKTRSSWRRGEMVDVPKPDGFVFDETKKSHQMETHSYERLYLRDKTYYDHRIRQANSDLRDMQKRLADWTAPEIAA